MERDINKGVTLIEIIAVIAILAVIGVLGFLGMNSSRQKARDSRRVADVRQIQAALKLYFADQRAYPSAPTAVALGQDDRLALCSNGGWKAACSKGDRTYLDIVPSAPSPADGDCNPDATQPSNIYHYTSTGTEYGITFCLGRASGELQAGGHTADPNGMK